MEVSASKLTVLFEEPFWVGIYERQSGGVYEVCKITFGAEPKEPELYAYFLKNWANLRFTPALYTEAAAKQRQNPKRMRREIARALQHSGIGTKAQQALKLQQEQAKRERRARARCRREDEAQRQFALRQEKRKEKHRGH